MNKFVMCLDDSFSDGCLMQGRVYDVAVEDYDRGTYSFKYVDGQWDRWRFKVVDKTNCSFAEAVDKLPSLAAITNQDGIKFPQKTLWDEYALAALTGIMARPYECGATNWHDRVNEVVKIAHGMMEVRPK